MGFIPFSTCFDKIKTVKKPIEFLSKEEEVIIATIRKSIMNGNEKCPAATNTGILNKMVPKLELHYSIKEVIRQKLYNRERIEENSFMLEYLISCCTLFS